MSLQRIFSRHRRPLALCTALWLALSPLPALAGLIRDAEIEQTLRTYLDPILTSADINPSHVRVFIVNDPSINAFVAGGMNIFVNTGLIMATKNPSMLVGVLAHETGHISGAHLSQMAEKTDRATLGSIIGAVLGAAMIASGAGEAGAGVIAGTQNMSLRNLLSGIRGNEEQADQAALKYLDENNISATGMLETFELLRRKQGVMDKSVDPYMQTHPLSSSRIAVVRNHIARSSIPHGAIPSIFVTRHERMLARLRAFTWTPEQTLLHYKETDTSYPALYARAVATFKLGRIQEGLIALEDLAKKKANDPFTYDTLGQLYFEAGLPKNSVNRYKSALKEYPDSALILTDLARSLITLDEPAYLQEALGYLDKATKLDDSNPNSWRLMATAYGKLKNNSMAYVALAQESALKGETRNAIAFADNALQGLPEISAGAQLARDIKTQAERHLIRQKEGQLF